MPLTFAEHAPRGDILGWIDHGKLAPLLATRQVIYLEAW